MAAWIALGTAIILGAVVIGSSFAQAGANALAVGNHSSQASGVPRLPFSSREVPASVGLGALEPSATPPAGFVTAMVFDPTNGEIYVANWDSSNVTAIDGSTGATVTTIPVGSNPEALAFNSAQNTVYVANSGSDNVSVISATSNTVIATIDVGVRPCAVTVDSANGDFYVANFGSQNVSVVSGTTNTVVTSITVANSADALAVDPVNGYVYVGNYEGANWLNVIDGSTNIALPTIPIAGGTSWSVAVDQGNGDIYVPVNGSGRVAVVDGAASQEVSNITVGGGPRAIAVDPVNGDVYVANIDTANVSVISGPTNTVVATVPVGLQPIVVAIDNITNTIYVANRGSDNVTVINGTSNTVVDSVSTGSEPSAIAIDPVSGKVYVSNYGSSNVSEIPTTPPSIQASFTESSVHTGTCRPFTENVTLMGSASGGVPPYNFTWSFGSGSALSYGPETNHTYAATGSYNVTLSVTDSERDTVSVTQPVGVPPPPGCLFPIVGGPSSNLPVQFFVIFGGTVVGLALLGVVVWFRRK